MGNQDDKKQYKNILVDAVMHLGDLIHATSIVPLLKELYPEAKISFLVEKGLVGVFENIDGIEHIIPYSYRSKGDYLAVFTMAQKLKKYKFDLSISLDPRIRLAVMTWAAGIPVRVGSPSVFGWKPGLERYIFTDFVDLGNWNVKEHPHAYNFQRLIHCFAKDQLVPFYQPRFTPPKQRRSDVY